MVSVHRGAPGGPTRSVPRFRVSYWASQPCGFHYTLCTPFPRSFAGGNVCGSTAAPCCAE
eukprot:scaffold63974_cov51-Attheya_sp.AAC.1